MTGYCDGVFGSHSLWLVISKGLREVRKMRTYRYLFENGVADTGLDLLDFFKSRGLIKTPDEQVHVARRSELLMIILAIRDKRQ